MTVTVQFEENGGEYLGYFCASGVSRVAFDPEQPRAIRLDAVRVELDERIDRIAIDGYGEQSTAEAWELPERIA